MQVKVLEANIFPMQERSEVPEQSISPGCPVIHAADGVVKVNLMASHHGF